MTGAARTGTDVFQTAPKLAELATKTFGRIDGLVINHGVLTPIARLADANVEEWKSHYDINLFGGVALVNTQEVQLFMSHYG